MYLNVTRISFKYLLNCKICWTDAVNSFPVVYLFVTNIVYYSVNEDNIIVTINHCSTKRNISLGLLYH